MKTRVSILALRREMANIRKDIIANKAVTEEYLKAGDALMADWHLGMVGVMEAGLKWCAAAIRREQQQRRGGRHG